jgi:hypothetical protein
LNSFDARQANASSSIAAPDRSSSSPGVLVMIGTITGTVR